MLTKEALHNYLADALQDLYDPSRLRTTPLTDLLPSDDHTDTPLAVRGKLLEAIEALKPLPGTSANSRAWRIYDILFYSYVQQFSRREVADQIGLSTRHLRREQRNALNVLTDYIWQQWSLGQRAAETTEAAQSRSATAAIDRELSWIKESSPKDPIRFNQALSSVVELTHNLVEHYGISLHVDQADALPDLAVHPTALRQVLLSLLTAAIHRSAGGQVNIEVQDSPTETILHMKGIPAPPSATTALHETATAQEDDRSGLEIARSLVEMWGGRLILSTDRSSQEASSFEATMTVPALACLPVLVIDDNVDTLHLLQRYVTGSRYRIVGTQDPREALLLAQEISPQIIVADVMMPEIDGWELLHQLRQHHRTADVPIIICTILPQRELALSVGADGFVQKPVNRAHFLSALDQQMALGGARDHKTPQ